MTGIEPSTLRTLLPYRVGLTIVRARRAQSRSGLILSCARHSACAVNNRPNVAGWFFAHFCKIYDICTLMYIHRNAQPVADRPVVRRFFFFFFS